MKLSKINIVLSCFLFLAFLSSPIYADGLTLGYNSGHNKHHYNRHHPSAHYNYNYGYGHQNAYNYQQYNHPYYQQRNHNNNTYSRNRAYTKPCHQVSKTVIDDYGDYHKVGGTMCYDKYGQPYIVSGSRFRIR